MRKVMFVCAAIVGFTNVAAASELGIASYYQNPHFSWPDCRPQNSSDGNASEGGQSRQWPQRRPENRRSGAVHSRPRHRRLARRRERARLPPGRPRACAARAELSFSDRSAVGRRPGVSARIALGREAARAGLPSSRARRRRAVSRNGIVKSRKACDQSVNCVARRVARGATPGRLIADVEIRGSRRCSSLDGLSSLGRPLPKQSARLGTRRSSKRMCGRRRAARPLTSSTTPVPGDRAATRALSGAVIEKCEAVFLGRLTPAQKRNYEARQQRCSDKYAREDGSLAVAEAALCTEAIAVSFARNAAAAGRIPAAPLAPVKASFDCGKARTKLEQLICSSDVIGGEDIDLSETYRKAFNSAAPDDPQGARRQREWLALLCGEVVHRRRD